MNTETSPSFWRTPGGIALCGFLLIAGLFLVLEHRAHALGVLPYLLLALCPLLHFFGHRGHGSHGGHSNRPEDKQ
jgi:hypothetical protein